MLKEMKQKKSVLLNHQFVRVVEENGFYNLYIKMRNGQWACQAPYAADLRGAIAALTLAVDIMAGKILLTDVTTLDERDFMAKQIDSIEIKAIEGSVN